MADLRGQSSKTLPVNRDRNTGLSKNHLPQLAFIHIPKTAGTSVTDTLVQIYGETTFPGMTTLDYPYYTDEELSQYRFYKGHAYRRDYDRFPTGTIKFTILREPMDRVLSWYTYHRQLDDAHMNDEFMYEASRLAKNNNVVEFIHSDSPFVVEHIRLGQIRQFLSPETLTSVGHRLTFTRSMRQIVLQEFSLQMECMHIVLTCEMLFLSFPLMMDQLGLPYDGQLARLNVSKQPVDVDKVDARRALIEVNGAEFAAYDQVRRREQTWIAANLKRLLALYHDSNANLSPERILNTYVLRD